MALKDPDTVNKMRSIIASQKSELSKKTLLLTAIHSNLDYLMQLHKQNSKEIDDYKGRNA